MNLIELLFTDKFEG